MAEATIEARSASDKPHPFIEQIDRLASDVQDHGYAGKALAWALDTAVEELMTAEGAHARFYQEHVGVFTRLILAEFQSICSAGEDVERLASSIKQEVARA